MTEISVNAYTVRAEVTEAVGRHRVSIAADPEVFRANSYTPKALEAYDQIRDALSTKLGVAPAAVGWDHSTMRL